MIFKVLIVITVECVCVWCSGSGVLHPGAVRGWSSEPKDRLLCSRISAGLCHPNLVKVWLTHFTHCLTWSVCLQAVESIRAVIALCDSADEELRHVAIETLLTLGEYLIGI